MKFRIDNVPTGATERDLQQLFSRYGKVLSVTLLSGPSNSEPLGSGLIELEDDSARNIGSVPDRCSFRETVIRITQDRSAADGQPPDNPKALSDTDASPTRQAYNRSGHTLHVISVEEVLDPDTGKPNGWCNYSFRSLVGSVTGLRQGTVAEVTLHAEEAAEAFNMRNILGQRRQPIWSSRQKKKGA
jgi:RNA recognition motif-containing protein